MYPIIKSDPLNIPNPSRRESDRRPSGRLRWADRLNHWLHALVVDEREPHIHQQSDRAGNVYWKVYDPMTHHSAVLDTESEVREWLEARYYAS